MKKVLMLSLLMSIVTIFFASNKIATDYFNGGEYAIAKSYFLSGKMDAMDNYYLGQIYIITNKKDSAQYYFNKGLQLDPANAYNKVGIATINNDAKSLDAIAKDKLYKKDIAMMIAIANAYGVNNNVAQVNTYVAKAKKIDKKNPLSYLFEGDQLMKLKQTNDAAQKYETAIYFEPNCKVALLKLAQIYENVRTTVAVEYLNKAITVDPQYAVGLSTLADLSYRKGFYPQAMDAFNKYLSLVKTSPSDYERQAAILYFNKKYDQALEAISKAPNTFIMNRLKMYSQNELGKSAEALSAGANLFKMKTDKDSIIGQDYTTYAKLLLENKQYTEAAKNYVSAYSLDETKINLLKEAAKAYENAKDVPNAIKYYKIIAEKPNSELSDLFMLGRTYYISATDETNTDTILKTQYLNEADAVFKTVSERMPDNYMGYFWRARTNTALDPESTQGLAKPHYEKALELMLPQIDKRKNDILEVYRYMTAYYYAKNDIPGVKTYLNKILEVDAQNDFAIQTLKALDTKSKPKAGTKK